MALYTLATGTPTQATQGSANTDTVSVDERGIGDVEIFITKDAFTEVRAGLFVGDRRVFPEPEGQPIQKPGNTGPVSLNYVLPGVPAEVELQAWAPNADFQHRVVCNVEAVPPDELTQPVRLESVGRATRERQPTPTPEDIMSAGQDR